MSWETVELGSLFKITSGGTPSRQSTEYYNGDIPWVKTGDLKTKYINQANEYITKEGLENSSARLYEPGTVLLAMYGATIGAVSILNIEASTNQACAAFVPSSKVDSVFLYYCLQNLKSYFLFSAFGGAQPNLSAGFLKSVRIPLPPLEEQRSIAAVLEKADHLRSLRRQALARLDDLVQSVFLEMFGDPATNPMGWEVTPIGHHISFKHGFAFQSEYFSQSGKYTLLTPGNFFKSGGYRNRGEKQKFFTGEFPNEYLLSNGDMLVAMTEQAPGLLGSPLFVPKTGQYLHNQRLGLVLSNELFNKDFLFSFFNTVYFREQVQFTSRGTKVKHTSPSKMGEISICIPPIELQNKFSKFMLKQRLQTEQSIATGKKLNNLFNALMQKTFKGELQFAEAEASFQQLEMVF